jgi:putative ABC transport system permease protein
MFVLRMALRETRSSWRRLLFFFICIAVGVAAIVTIRSVIQSVRNVFSDQARSLIAADVIISTNREWTDEPLAKIAQHLKDAGSAEKTETIETPTMVRPADSSRPVARMVELRAVQRGFPLYGSLDLEGGTQYSHALLENHGVLVRPELLAALKVSVGEQIVIGQVPFTIRGVIVNEPGRSVGNFSMGPRILIDYDDLPSTGLLTFGSRARRAMLIRVPESRTEALVSAIRDDFRDDFINVRSVRATDDAVGEDFDRAENYLSLVGLVVVILGGIAVSSVTRVFVHQKMRGIAVLKCLGASSSQIMTIYLLQVLSLGLAGSVLGVGIARLAIAGIPYVLDSSANTLLASVKYGITWSAALQGIGSGVLVSLLFSVVPLMQVRAVKPSLLLRDEKVMQARDWTRLIVTALVSLALVGLTAWQAASLQVGLIVCAGFCALALVLQLAARALVRAIAPLANAPSFPLRHAVLHLSRPGSQTKVILLAVGLGAFFIVGVRSLQSSLLEEFSLEATANAPDMFLMDVQRSQADALTAFLGSSASGASNFR